MTRPSASLAAERRSLAIDALTRDPEISHDEIAGLLGMTRPSATRLIASLRAAGVVPPAPPLTGTGRPVRVQPAILARLRAITGEDAPAAAITVALELAEATEAIACVVARAETQIAAGKPPAVEALLAELRRAITSTDEMRRNPAPRGKE